MKPFKWLNDNKEWVFSGIGVLLITLIFSLNKCGRTLKAPQLTIYVHGLKGRQDIVLENEGKLIVDFGNRRDAVKIGENGRTNFGEIHDRFMGKEIGISIKVNGFELVSLDEVHVFDGEPIYLAVQQTQRLGVVKGRVRSLDGSRFLSHTEIEVDGETTLTDSSGNFYLLLPKTKWQKEYIIFAKKEGYHLKEEKYYPELGNLEIRLAIKKALK